MGLWFSVFAVHLYWRHDRFGTFDHDLGIWDQSAWLLANGELFNTVRGLEVFGFHVSPALYLYAPFYWLGAGPSFLNITMVAALTLGAIPVFLAARHHLGNEWHALLVAVVFLVNYVGQWMLQETFHPEVMAITPLLFAYLASLRRRWPVYAGWVVFAMSWKEDVALAVFMLGVVLLVRRQPRVGVATMAGAALWFVLATQVIVPAFSPGGNFTENLFGDLGSSPTEIVETSVTDPSIPLEHLDRADAPGYVFDLAAPFGFTPFLSPLALLIGLPQTLVNLLAIHGFFWETKVHYAALPLTAMTIAAIEGVARPRRRSVRRFLLGLMAVGACYTAINWGIAPFTQDYRSGFWPLDPPPNQAALEAAVDVPAEEDAVSASYNLVPHLSHRSNIYTFPNPWRLQNWGVEGENPHDPDLVDWLVVDLRVTQGSDEVLLEEILDGDHGTQWEVVDRSAEVLIARRVDG